MLVQLERIFTVGAGALMLAVATSCGSSGPEWIDLTAGFRPASLPLATRADQARAGFYTDAGGTWQTTDLTLEDWEPGPWPGVWQTARPSVAIGSPELGAATRLLAGEENFVHVRYGGKTRLDELPLDSFAAFGDYLYVLPEAGTPPPESTYWSFIDMGTPKDGSWRLEVDGLAANGVPVLPGTSQVVHVEAPAASALRFRTLVLGPSGAEVVLTIRAGGKLLLEHHQETGLVARMEDHVVALPEGDLELEFGCEGPPAFAAFLAPRIGPLDIGTYGARPWGATRPDLVVFLADTFRADNLTAYGGQGLAPRLDELAEQSVVFTRARASSSWTLPSHASIFSGMHPPQHGAVDGSRSLDGNAATIAETLRDAGYRTAAVTERGWVVPEFGLDQGFETFEYFTGFENTLAHAIALAEHDDGRPLFLFIHTYRVHSPYRVSDEVRAELGIRDDWDAVDTRHRLFMGGEYALQERAEERRVWIDALRQLYRGTVIDLDRGFATLFDRFEGMGILGQDDYLVFLSDHGESFDEHGTLWHGVDVWDELTRIPLLVYSPSLEPFESNAPASHVDVAPTIAQLLGTRVDRSWAGRSLFAPPAPGELHDVFSYACKIKGPGRFAFLDGTRKVVMRPREDSTLEPEVAWAFDLAVNPSESEDPQLTAEEVAELMRRWRSRLDEAETELLFPEQVTLTKGHEEELRDLGYLGSEQE